MGRLLSLVNGLVFDGNSLELKEHPVHTESGRVVGLEGPPPDGARVVDARGRLVIPGLIDAHFHAYGIGFEMMEVERLPMSYIAHKAARRLEAALRRGFTTVRDPSGGDIGLRMALEQGIIPGPRYLYTGPALSQTGGHGDPRPEHLLAEHSCGYLSEIVDGVANLRRAVRERFRTGAHCIKIFTSGGVMSPSDPIRLVQYDPEEVRAVCAEAARRESYVSAHAYSPEAIVHSVTNGVRTIEHGNLLDADSASRMAEHGAFLVPTLITYDATRRRGDALGLPEVSRRKNLEVAKAGLEAVEIARQAGVPIGLGTDLIGDVEDDQLLEFRLRCQVENPGEVLLSATSTNARIIRRPDLGVIEVGATSDLVVLSGNPFDDPGVLWDPERLVVKAGNVVGD